MQLIYNPLSALSLLTTENGFSLQKGYASWQSFFFTFFLPVQTIVASLWAAQCK